MIELKQKYHNINPLYVTRDLKNVCPVPLKANTYHGCSYGCLYCNTNLLTKTRTSRETVPIPLDYVKKTFNRAYKGTGNGEIHKVIREGWPVQLGVLADPFPEEELKYRNTLKFLQYMDFILYPTQILTKSDIILEPEYLNLLGNHTQVMVSIPSLNPQFQLLEPGVPTANQRFNVLLDMVERGIKCTLRIWPIIPGINDKTLTLIERAAALGITEIQAATAHLYHYQSYLQPIEKILGTNILKNCEEKGIPLQKKGIYYTPPPQYVDDLFSAMKEMCGWYGITFLTPDHPVINQWKCCCGDKFPHNKHALKCGGHHLGEGVTAEDYIEDDNYPFHTSFHREYHAGSFTNTFHDIEYDPEKKVYKKK